MYKQRSQRTGVSVSPEEKARRRRRYESMMSKPKKVGKGYTGSKANKKYKDAPTFESDSIKDRTAILDIWLGKGEKDLSYRSKPEHAKRAVKIETTIRPDYLEMERVKRRSMSDVLNSIKEKFGPRHDTKHTNLEAKQTGK